jgi:hypothetical protein
LIGGQSIGVGEQVTPGTAVDIALLQAPNALLIYDDNDLTLINLTEEEMFLSGVRFTSVDGATPATYAATDRWTDSLRARRCAQIWTVQRNGPKALPECRTIHAWFSSLDPTTHFWTGSNGATKFNVTVGAQEVAVCEIAAGRCEFYLPTASAAETSVPYLYMAYTPDRFILYNNSPDQWMSLEGVVLYSLLGAPEGIPLGISDPSFYAGQTIIGDVKRLAPGQCIFFTTGQADQPPQDCAVIVRLDFNPSNAFWSVAFGVGNKDRLCPAPQANQLSLCVLPREP